MINFNTTKADQKLITKIAQRAVKLNPDYDFMDASMDVSAVHLNDCKLDLKKFIGFDDFNFGHDAFGIARHIDRNTGKLQNCFLPRCSA
ncbi:MAG: DUF6874 family protein [Candidatus Anammoxibacter sp.]